MIVVKNNNDNIFFLFFFYILNRMGYGKFFFSNVYTISWLSNNVNILIIIHK